MSRHHHPFNFSFDVDVVPDGQQIAGGGVELRVVVLANRSTESIAQGEIRSIAEDSLVEYEGQPEWAKPVGIPSQPRWRTAEVGTYSVGLAPRGPRVGDDVVVSWMNARAADEPDDAVMTPSRSPARHPVSTA